MSRAVETLAPGARMPAGLFRRAVHEQSDVCDRLLQGIAAQIRTLGNRANEQSSLGSRQRRLRGAAAHPR